MYILLFELHMPMETADYYQLCSQRSVVYSTTISLSAQHMRPLCSVKSTASWVFIYESQTISTACEKITNVSVYSI